MSQLLGSRALTEKWANIEAHAGLEREKRLYSNWAAPHDSEAISDFRGPRRSNQAKHGIDFETARLVFDDPHCVTFVERVSGGEERWHTISSI